MTVGARMSEEGLSLTSSMAITEDGRKKEMMCNFFQVDADYLPLFQIKLLEGRNLSDSLATDKNDALLVNEAYVQQMGWKSGLGKQVDMGGKATIVGVVKNFYYRSLHNLVEPLILVYNKNPQYFNTATIKIDAVKLPMVQQLFRQYFPSLPFEAQFYDDVVAKRYERDRITMSLFKNFTLFAIFVSCLGLYGLVTLIVVQRTKEIGIRKVLGATIKQLFLLLSKDFMRLVFIALVIALPLAGFMMYKWLRTYAYHVSLQWTMFLIPAILILLIALTVISWQIIKTALANPVKSLGRE
jgi:putative ABC transport system permease protein